MHVLLIVNSDIGRGTKKGHNTIGSRFEHIANYLVSRGDAVDIIARSNYGELSVRTPWYGAHMGRGLNALRMFVFPTLRVRDIDVWLFDRFALRKLRSMRLSKDVVAHVGEYAPKTIAWLKSQGIRVYLDMPIAHPGYVQTLAEQGIQVGSETPYIPGYVTEAIDAADELIVPSEFVAHTVRAHYSSQKPIHISPFGVDIETRVRESNDGVFTVLFVGAVNIRKGVPYLLEAWQEANIPHARLVLCGRVYKELQPYKQKYADADTIYFAGFVDPREWYAKADVCILPSLMEGSAKVVYEAMSYGLPVITTPNAGSIIQDGVTGCIVPIADVGAIVDALKKLATDTAFRSQLGEEAKTTVRDYTWEAYAARVVALYTATV